jgi:hypothetical protein
VALRTIPEVPQCHAAKTPFRGTPQRVAVRELMGTAIRYLLGEFWRIQRLSIQDSTSIPLWRADESLAGRRAVLQIVVNFLQ